MVGALRFRSACGAAIALAALPSIALGQPAPISDPTRPPTSVVEPTATLPSAGVSGAGLQTVILRKGNKPVAIINGMTVELGGKVGESRLVKLSESEAVLQGPNGREVLRLIPAAEKTKPGNNERVKAPGAP